ncbi:MAG: hypothetical protein HY561_02620 [Gemmatimonadetes bacterium]|nr:hypothetical protein [Gemmatimonadota bacterium]
MPHEHDPLRVELRAILDEIATREFRSLDELNAFVARRVAEYNARPQPRLGGLSPHQAAQLLAGDWKRRGPLRLNTELGAAEVRPSRLYRNARAFLQALRDEGPALATEFGNLNRRFVSAMLDRLEWDEGERERVRHLRRHYRVINEEFFQPLHLLRVLLGLAHLVRRRRGRFRLTRRAALLLDEERAGELYASLFRTFFRGFNLAYLHDAPDSPALQETLALTLYRMRAAAAEWHRPLLLAERVLPDAVREQPADLFGENAAAWAFEGRVVQPLVWFGLLERRDLPGRIPGPEKFEVRKTPLFDRFLRFDFQ